MGYRPNRYNIQLGRGVDPLTALPPCFHRNVVPVESVVTGETVARLCLDCDGQLAS